MSIRTMSIRILPRYAAPLTVALFLAACGNGGGDAAQQQAQGGPPPTPVPIIVAEPQAVLLEDRLPGRVVAFRSAEVRPQVAGVIEKRLFDEGTVVQAGQQLYQIDPNSYRATLNAAQAELARAEANYALNKKKLDRYEKLVRSQAVSRQTYDDTVAAAADSKAAVQSARAQVRVAAIDVDYTKVTAPITGIIGRSLVSEGALVTANQVTPMTTITQLDPVYVDLTQSSAKVLELRQKIASGQLQATDSLPVTLLLDNAGTAYEHRGTLRLSEVIVDQATDSISLRAVFPNPMKVLLPGMFVRADVAQGRMDAGFVIPQKAIQRAPNGEAFVFIAGEGDKVARRDVTLDRTIGSGWLVKAGLQAGDRVIVGGFMKVRDGAVVAPKTEAEMAAPAQPPSTPPKG